MIAGVCIDCDGDLEGDVLFGRCLSCREATLPDGLRELVSGVEDVADRAVVS